MKRKQLNLKNVLILTSIIFSIIIVVFFVNKCFSKNYFLQISYEEFISKYDNNEELILLIYRENCYNCDTYIETINQAANKSQRNIYYIDIGEIMNPEQYSNLWNITKASGTPALVKISNKKVIKIEVGSKTKDEVIEFINE